MHERAPDRSVWLSRSLVGGRWSVPHEIRLLKYPAVLYGLIGVTSFLVLFAIAARTGLNKPFIPGDDNSQYASIAASVARGHGYKDPVGVWPTKAATDRVPVFPLVLSIGMRLDPRASEQVISRVTNLVCLALAGIAMGALCRRLGLRPGACLVGGLCLSLAPVLISLALQGLSEICFLLVVTAGLVLVFSNPRCFYPGCVVIGLGTLVRPNFIVVPFFFAALALLVTYARKQLTGSMALRGALALCLTTLPALLWMVRNDAITGRFPLLTTDYGETFYGSNNDVTANQLQYWGYWTFPDNIPGETPKKILATRMNDVDLNDYYYQRGADWIESHPSALPRLLLGKTIRSLALVPWSDSPSWQEFAVFTLRLVFLALVLITMPYWWHAIDRRYLLFLGALAISHAVTTVMMYGLVRFSFCFFEIFTAPCLALGLQKWVTTSREGRAAVGA